MNNHRAMARFSGFAVLVLFSCFVFINSAVAANIVVPVTITGNEMPWNWINGGLNTSYQFGVNDGAGPALIAAANGFDFTSGNLLTLTYISGVVSVGSSFPNTNANGDTAAAVNNGNGSSGTKFPSFYMNSATYPINLGELVGTFASSSGAIVGTPFAVGDGPTPVTIPAGATRLQLGVNDDIFADNTGSWSIQVSGSAAMTAGVPEPNAAALCGFGMILLAFALYRRTANN